MADYKNEQWWIELRKSLDGFDSSIMSDSDLSKWNGAKLGGSRGGVTNSKSGHMSKLGKSNGSKNGKSEKSRNAARIMGLEVGKYNLSKTTKEQKSIGGKKGGKIRASQSDFHQHLCSMANKSGEKRTDNKIIKMKSILKLIKKKEFRLLDVKNACDKMNIKDSNYHKKILKEKSLVKQIHKGYNQFNPSLYIKIK